jgi:hypothetical protein
MANRRACALAVQQKGHSVYKGIQVPLIEPLRNVPHTVENSPAHFGKKVK